MKPTRLALIAGLAVATAAFTGCASLFPAALTPAPEEPKAPAEKLPKGFTPRATLTNITLSDQWYWDLELASGADDAVKVYKINNGEFWALFPIDEKSETAGMVVGEDLPKAMIVSQEGADIISSGVADIIDGYKAKQAVFYDYKAQSEHVRTYKVKEKNEDGIEVEVEKTIEWKAPDFWIQVQNQNNADAPKVINISINNSSSDISIEQLQNLQKALKK